MHTDWTDHSIPNQELYLPAIRHFYTECNNPWQVLQLAVPKAAGPHPVIIWFHGGGMTCDGREGPAELYNGRFLIVEVRYRLSPETPATGAVDDAAAAIAWVFRHLPEFNGDRRYVFSGGMSAGAYLAALTGFHPQLLAAYGINNCELAGLLLISGQMTTHFQLKNDLGYRQEGIHPVIDDYAPLAHAAADAPPVLFLTGESGRDMAARPEENALFAATLRGLGHRCVEQYALPGCDHPGAFDSCDAYILRFIQRIMENQK